MEPSGRHTRRVWEHLKDKTDGYEVVLADLAAGLGVPLEAARRAVYRWAPHVKIVRVNPLTDRLAEDLKINGFSTLAGAGSRLGVSGQAVHVAANSIGIDLQEIKKQARDSMETSVVIAARELSDKYEVLYSDILAQAHGSRTGEVVRQLSKAKILYEYYKDNRWHWKPGGKTANSPASLLVVKYLLAEDFNAAPKFLAEKFQCSLDTARFAKNAVRIVLRALGDTE